MPNIDRSSVGFPLRGTCRTARCFTTMSRDPESAELTASPIPPVEIKQHQTVILVGKSHAVHFRRVSLVHAFSCLCGGIIQNETTQECIPGGYVPPARYRTGGLLNREHPPLDRDPPVMWPVVHAGTETPL